MSKATENHPDERLRLEYVPLSTALHWERNPKRHDAGAIWQSIALHGFKDPPKFEPALNGGQGGLVEGNGRTHVLREMKNAGEETPRGIIAGEEDWLIPVLFGVDAESERSAESYGVDHNNLTLLGGDFGAVDVSRLWNEAAYAELLADLAQSETLPVTVDGDDLDALIQSLAAGGSNHGASSGSSNSGGAGGAGESSSSSSSTRSSPGAPAGERYKEQYGVIVLCADEANQKAAFERLQEEGYECKIVVT